MRIRSAVICLLLLLSLIVSTLSQLANLDPDALRTLEANFLRKMKLDSRPRPKRRTPVPEHLQVLYEQLTQQEQQFETPFLTPSTADLQFDSAKSFFPEDMPESKRSLSDSSEFHFDLEAVPSWEHLEQAELRLHVAPDGSSHPNGQLRLSVYELVRNHTVLTDSVIVPCDLRQSSATLDLTATVERWRRKPGRRGAVQVRVSRSRRASCSPKLAARPVAADSPVLIVYTTEQQLQRVKRGAPNERKRKQKHRHRHEHKKNRRIQRPEMCGRQSLVVDFDAVGWNDWIVAPPSYEAFMCLGSCPYPLPDNLNATNHAIVQSLVHSVTPGVVPPACCVPTRLASVSLLYIDQYERVVLRTYEDMVVEECGCR